MVAGLGWIFPFFALKLEFLNQMLQCHSNPRLSEVLNRKVLSRRLKQVSSLK